MEEKKNIEELIALTPEQKRVFNEVCDTIVASLNRLEIHGMKYVFDYDGCLAVVNGEHIEEFNCENERDDWEGWAEVENVEVCDVLDNLWLFNEGYFAKRK